MDVMQPWEDVLELWFGALDADGLADGETRKRWWTKDPAFDADLKRRFGALRDDIAAGGHRDWLDLPRGRLAFVILLDQVSRNIYRDTPRMYEADALAVEVAFEGVRLGHDLALATDERTFLYMPFMHAEDPELQDRGVRLFRGLRNELAGDAKRSVNNGVKFAIQHRDIVAEFGRFPHRNAILGRESTASEVEFLKQPGSSF
jgi:uncharacterized protein (DUF924 family)